LSLVERAPKVNAELISFHMSPMCFGKRILLKILRRKKKKKEKNPQERFEG